MGRKPRILVAGAVYHVYNRVSSGERVFESGEVAEKFLDLVAEVKERDGWTMFAWCLMANHYHLVVRAGEVPLSRGMHRVQNGFSRWFNRREGRTGPLWQSRYHAKVVRDESYVWQLILYVHLNPLRAGVVRDLGEYPYSGHGEILRWRKGGLVDRNPALLCFGTTRRAAVRRYREAVEGAAARLRGGQAPMGDGEAPDEEPDAELWFDPEVPYMDALGRSSVGDRPEITAEEFLGAAFEGMGLDGGVIRSATKSRQVVRARRLAVTLAVERWGLRAGLLAAAMGRPAQQVSVWTRDGTRLRLEDPVFRKAYEELDRSLRRRLAGD